MLEVLFAVAAILIFINWLTDGALEDDGSIDHSTKDSASRSASTRPSLDLDKVDTNTLRKAARELGVEIADYTDRRTLIRRVKEEIKSGGVSQILRKKARSTSSPNSKQSSSSNLSLKKKSRKMNVPKKLPLSDFMLSNTSDSSLRSVIGNANSHLVALRNAVGDEKYGRSASIRLVGEAIVAFKMASQLLQQNQAGASASNLSLQQAERKVESLREDLYEENKQVFKPYFENEPGVVDLDLSLLRRASEQAAGGDEKALSQIEYMFTYYHAVLGMYYGWQSFVLSGMSVSEAASKVSGTTGNNLHPPALQTLTAHFGAILVNQHPSTVGKFEPLYAPPSH